MTLDSDDLSGSRLDQAIEAYYEQRTRCGVVETELFLSEHAAVAEELRAFLETVEELDQIASVGPKTGSSSSGAGPVRTERSLPRTFGDYELLEQLGRGGMGVVYRARQRSLNRTVAVKLLLAGQLASNEDIERFRAEAVSAAQLRHPNIIAIHEVGELAGEYFFSMDYVGGGNLAQQVQQNPLPATVAAEHVLTLARAVSFAHEQGLLHRDLKPSNVLLDSQSHELRIGDFGLSRRLDALGGHTMTGQVLGTPGYMSPEQAAGQRQEVAVTSDVYALGAILYELLTMRPPFAGETPWETIKLVIETIAVSPSKLNPRVPRDLETICLKCLEKDRRRRYASAADLADDLQRFLRHEPIRARAVGPLGRAWRWCRRNARLAAALAIAAICFSAFLVALVVSSTWRARTAAVEVSHRRWEAAIEKLHAIRLADHYAGWSRDAWNLVEEAAPLRTDPSLRDQAAAVLLGWDAQQQESFDFPSTAVAFDDRGERILWGGTADTPTRLWNRSSQTFVTSDHPQVSPEGALGLVLFAVDGNPWQVTVSAESGVIVWDMERRQLVHTLTMIEEPLPATGITFEPKVTATPRGEFIAASQQIQDGSTWVAVWSTKDGVLQRRFQADATALALTPDGSYLAIGTENGKIEVWSMATGTLSFSLQRSEVEITSLEFGRNLRRSSSKTEWLLASGDAGGTIAIWDLQRKLPRSYCRGSTYHVYDLAFSPDGVTLASCGRYKVKLWDVASGRLLLDIKGGNFMHQLAFSPDARKLAVTSISAFGYPGKSVLWELQNGRGIRSLRGPSSSVTRVWYSRDGRLVAALSHDWEVAVWEADSGLLKFVLEVPPGFLADNADVAFSPDHRWLAFASGENATIWDLQNGDLEKSWRLPPGLGDQIAFRSNHELWLFRTETEDPSVGPFSYAPGERYPRVIQLRNLLAKDQPLAPYAQIRDFPLHVFGVAGTSDGSVIVVDGHRAGPKEKRRAIRAYDGRTGKLLWSAQHRNAGLGECLVIDPSDQRLLVSWNDSSNASLHKVSTFELVAMRPGRQNCLSPGGKFAFEGNPRTLLWAENAMPVVRLGVGIASAVLLHAGQSITKMPVVRLGVGIASDCEQPHFSPAGREVAWGASDGSLLLADLPTVLGTLEQIGLARTPADFRAH